MKKNSLIQVVFLLLIYGKSFSQVTWHSVTDTLKSPPTSTHFQIAVSFYNRLDTAACMYKISNGNTIYKGFKLVYVFEGHFIDTPNTVAVFFDDKKQRTYKVKEYSFN